MAKINRKDWWPCRFCSFGKGGPGSYLTDPKYCTCKKCLRAKVQCCAPATSCAERQLNAQKAADRKQRKAQQGKGQAAGEQGTKTEKQLQQQMQKQTEQMQALQKQVEQLQSKASKEDPAEAEDDPKKANSARIKRIDENIKEINSMPVAIKEELIGDEAVVLKKLEELRQEKQQLQAKNISFKPLKTQVKDTGDLVKRIETELESLDKEKDQLLEEYWKLIGKTEQKQSFPVEEKTELDSLEERVAAEEAAETGEEKKGDMDVDDQDGIRRETLGKMGLNSDRLVRAANILFSNLGPSNMQQVLVQLGAIEQDFDTFKECVDVLKAATSFANASEGPAKQDQGQQPPQANATATASGSQTGNPPAGGSPEGKDVEMAEIERRWIEASKEMADFESLSPAAQGKKKQAWLQVNCKRFKPQA